MDNYIENEGNIIGRFGRVDPASPEAMPRQGGKIIFSFKLGHGDVRKSRDERRGRSDDGRWTNDKIRNSVALIIFSPPLLM